MAACPVGRVPPDMRKDGYFMKSMKRRLLSLFMAMVMVCSLVPGALAAATVSITGTPTTNPVAGPSTSVTLSSKVEGADEYSDLQYSWSVTGVGTTSTTNQSSVTISCPSAGSVTATLTVTGTKDSQPGQQVGTANTTFQVDAATIAVTDVTVSPKTTTVKVGATASLSATVSPTNATEQGVTWSSSNSSMATVDDKGVVRGVAPGEVTITATSKGDPQKKDTCTVTVQPADPVAPTSITVTPSTQSVTVGKEVQLTATVLPTTATQTVTWESSNTSVATVDQSGKVTTKATGTATITAKTTVAGSNMSGQCALTVVDGVKKVTIAEPTTTTIYANGTSTTLPTSVTLTATVETTGGSTQYPVTWTSSNTNVKVTPTSGNSNQAVVSVGSGYLSAQTSATITAKAGDVSATTTITVVPPVTFTGAPSTLSSYGANATVSPNVASALGGISSITWDSSNRNVVDVIKSSVNNTATVTAVSNGTATITATVTTSSGTFYGKFDVTVKFSAALTPSVVVYDSNPGYGLDDIPDEGNTSIVSQLDSQVRSKIGNSRYDYYKLRFASVGNSRDDGYLDANTRTDYYNDELEDIVFYPTANLTSSNSTATETFEFSVEVYNSSNSKVATLSGLMTFTIKRGDSVGSGDIVYSASLGQDVSFDVSDFEDFYNDKYSRGYLEYVTFGSSTANGTLYNEDGKSAGSSSYYVDPSSRQKGLDGIYFSPKSTMKKSTTVKISFTAYGTSRNDSGEGKAEGTVTIIYLNDSAKDITYNTTAGKVTLNAQDFIDAYKEATGSKTAPSNLTIEFQNIPSSGTLTYTGGSKDKDLTKSNVKSNRYTTKNSGSYRLAQLTYTGTKGKDTIDYIAYSGSTAQFTGKVVFNGTAAVPTDVVVTYGSTGGQAVRFSQNDFVSANSAMSKATKVRFVAPANGTLLMNGANASGVDIATTLLGTVTYQPKSGFNGQDKIIFAAYDASNNTVASGTVNVTVIGNPTTGTTPGGTPGGVSDVSQFKDVSATAWYRDNLATLVRKGIITGKGEGKFDPLGTVTYGEALKMVLQACGYTAALGTGSQWAINYKNLAVSRGWISSDIDLNAAISRNATAELTAKVLGVSAVTSGSPFADEANGYAAALYYTSPQIFAGSPNPNGGKPLFKNSSPLLRQEVCAVICRVSDYHTQHTTNNMPDGI